MSPKKTMEGQYAGFATRLTAVLIDIGIIAVLNAITTGVSALLLSLIAVDLQQCPDIIGTQSIAAYTCYGFAIAYPILSGLFIGVYAIFFWGTTGQTPGKAIMGARVVRMDGEHMDFGTAFRRLLWYAVSLFAFGMGFFWIILDNRRQGWHDRFAGTCVLYSWRAREDDNIMTRLPRWIRRVAPPPRLPE